MPLKSLILILQALRHLQPHWPQQPQQPLKPHWPQQPLKPYFIKELPFPYAWIILGTKMTNAGPFL